MTVKVLISFSGRTMRGVQGEVLDFPADVAKQLIKEGFVEATKAEKSEPKPKAAAK